MSDLAESAAKAADIASTYVQVLIGLASGLITAALGIYPFLIPIAGMNFTLFKASMICFGISLIAGLFGLGGLVNATAGKRTVPTNEGMVRAPVTIQLAMFGIATALLIMAFPF
jgi:hypothetical protein